MAVVAGHDDGQVIVLYEVPVNEGPCNPPVAVGEGMNLSEPMVEARRQQQGMVDLGLSDVFGVPVQSVDWG